MGDLLHMPKQIPLPSGWMEHSLQNRHADVLCKAQGAVSYLLMGLIFLPKANKTHGTGRSATAMNPYKLMAHPILSRSYTGVTT